MSTFVRSADYDRPTGDVVLLYIVLQPIAIAARRSQACE